MARPRKQTVDYFPHYVGESKTKRILSRYWGNDGYAFWFKLLELLCAEDGHRLQLDLAMEWEDFLVYTCVEESVATAMLNKLAELGKIDEQLWQEDKLVWCASLIDNLRPVYAKRKISAPQRPPGKEFLSRKCQSDAFDDAQKQESRAEESRAEHSKEYNPSACCPAEQQIISLPLNDKSEYPLYEEQQANWQELYPAVDVEQELRKMKGWLLANPTKRKTSRGILRFINNWLAREQDKGASSKTSPKPENCFLAEWARDGE